MQIDAHFQGQIQQQAQFSLPMGQGQSHRHTFSMSGQQHIPQQPSNLSLHNSTAHDLGDMDDSGIGMSLMDDETMSKFSYNTADLGPQLMTNMTNGDMGANMV